MDYLIGQTLGRYKINKSLGKGGMGAVFKARDQELDRDVAVKLMHPEYAHRTDFTGRFRQEARAAARLDHPGIVKVHDFGEAQNYLYLVMEFIPGVNLRYMLHQLSKEKRWITLVEAVQIVRETAYALAYAHEMQVLHRDIKPANIMLKEQTARGSVAEAPVRPVITDLGLAKLQDTGLQTMEGMSIGGTPAYMSPEQAQGQTVDARSDVYSLGVLLFELAMGQRPYPIRSSPDAVRYHVHEPLPQPSQIRPDVDPVLEMILLKALAKQPHERYHSAAMLGDELQGIQLEQLPTSVPATALHGTADLFTLYRQNRDQSPAPITPSPSPQRQSGSFAGDQIRIMRPDGSTYSIPFTGMMMRIGREQENDIVLNDNRVSRFHALVEREGNGFRIVDQGSANGLMLSQQKLEPNQSTTWMLDQAVRMGSHLLFLQPGEGSVPELGDMSVAPPRPSLQRGGYQGGGADTLIDAPAQRPPAGGDAERQPAPLPRNADVGYSFGERPKPRSLLPMIAGLLLILFLVGGGYGVWQLDLLNRAGGEDSITTENNPETEQTAQTDSALATTAPADDGQAVNEPPEQEANPQNAVNIAEKPAAGNEEAPIDVARMRDTEVISDTATLENNLGTAGTISVTNVMVPAEQETVPTPINIVTETPSPTATQNAVTVVTATLGPTGTPTVAPTSSPIYTPTPEPPTDTPTPNTTETGIAQQEATNTAREANPAATAEQASIDARVTSDAATRAAQAVAPTSTQAAIPPTSTAPVFVVTATSSGAAAIGNEYTPNGNEVRLISPVDDFDFSQATTFRWAINTQEGRIIESFVGPNSGYYFEPVVIDNSGTPKGMTGASKNKSARIDPSPLNNSPFDLTSGRTYQWTVLLVRCEGAPCHDGGTYIPLGEVASRRTFKFSPSSSSSGSSGDGTGSRGE